MLIRAFLSMSPGSARKALRRELVQADCLVVRARPGIGLWEELAADSFDLLLLEPDRLPEPAEETLASFRDLPEQPNVVLVTEHPLPPDRRARYLAAGCLTVVYTGVDGSILKDQVHNIARRTRNEALARIKMEQTESYRLGDFVTSSPSMKRLMHTAQRVVDSDTSLLILGETGVGKEWLARAIHEEGPRAKSPWITVNLAAIPETLLESALFGHEEGAFTDAVRSHRGYFELAHTGTIFLDEIAEMPTHLQVKLLRVLQEKRFKRLGGEEELEVDVRIVAATNLDLQQEIAAGRFRADLYYRIGVVTLSVPPLRERREDIVDLVQSYLEVFRLRLRRPVYRLSDAAMDALLRYRWPGNVRELMNVIERAVLLCASEEVDVRDLPLSVAGESPGGEPVLVPMELGQEQFRAQLERPLVEARRDLVASFERVYLQEMLARTGGRVGDAARLAGITPRALYDKMRRYGLRKEEFKPAGRTEAVPNSR